MSLKSAYLQHLTHVTLLHVVDAGCPQLLAQLEIAELICTLGSDEVPLPRFGLFNPNAVPLPQDAVQDDGGIHAVEQQNQLVTVPDPFISPAVHFLPLWLDEYKPALPEQPLRDFHFKHVFPHPLGIVPRYQHVPLLQLVL